jgi:hypothetical protein
MSTANSFLVCSFSYLISFCGSFLVALSLLGYPRILFYSGFPLLFICLEYIAMALRGQSAGFLSSRVVVVLLCGLLECTILEHLFQITFLVLPVFLVLTLMVIGRFLILTNTLSYYC